MRNGMNARRNGAGAGKVLAKGSRFWRRMERSVWFRPAVASVLSAVTALIAGFLNDIIPQDAVPDISRDTISALLTAVSSSMLGVTTFAVSIFIGALAIAGGSTARVVQLVASDRHTLNALASFIGAFIYAIVARVALDMKYYGPAGRFVLLIATLLALTYLIKTLIGWISHVTSLGRMSDVMERLLESAQRSLGAFRQDPCEGAMPLDPTDAPLAPKLYIDDTGYIGAINTDDLEELAKKLGGRLLVTARAGDFVHPNATVARWIGPELPEDFQEDFEDAFDLSGRDDLEDPRFSLDMLSEIASKALSPGINDTATAVTAIHYMESALAGFAGSAVEETRPRCRHVARATVSLEELFDSACTMIARDGAGAVEVGIRFQRMLAVVAEAGRNSGRDDIARLARQHAAHAFEMAKEKLPTDRDRARVKAAGLLAAGQSSNAGA